jgi:imidazolonepropionase-like amidohydrolase
MAFVGAAAATADSLVRYVGAHASRDSDLWQAFGEQPLAITRSGTRITDVRILQADETPDPAVTRIDVTGLTVLPGLIDAHTHHATEPNLSEARQQLAQELRYGITTVRDMAGDVRLLGELQREGVAGEIEAPAMRYSALVAGADFFADPRTHAATIGLTAGEVPWMRAIGPESDPDEVIAEARGSGAAGLKIYANLPAPTVESLIAAGHRAHFPVWTHLAVYPAGPFAAVGATSVSHVCMLARAILEPDKRRYGHADEPDYSGFDPDRPEIAAYGEALVAAGTVLDATLSVYPEMTAQSRRGCSRPLAGAITRRLVKSGVTIAAGTDHDPGDGSPAALDDELRALVKDAGFTPAEALRAATRGSATALGASDTLGRIATGYAADLLFYARDPAESLEHLKSLTRIVHFGRDHLLSEHP